MCAIKDAQPRGGKGKKKKKDGYFMDSCAAQHKQKWAY